MSWYSYVHRRSVIPSLQRKEIPTGLIINIYQFNIYHILQLPHWPAMFLIYYLDLVPDRLSSSFVSPDMVYHRFFYFLFEDWIHQSEQSLEWSPQYSSNFDNVYLGNNPWVRHVWLKATDNFDKFMQLFLDFQMPCSILDLCDILSVKICLVWYKALLTGIHRWPFRKMKWYNWSPIKYCSSFRLPSEIRFCFQYELTINLNIKDIQTKKSLIHRH